MIKIGDYEWRNIVQQIDKNKDDIAHILEINNLLIGAGVIIVGNANSMQDLPADYEGSYGDAYLVGSQSPYQLVVWTRPIQGEEEPHWFNVGNFPATGPQGPKGEQGERGEKGDRGPQGDRGLRGPQGITGPQGEKGDTGLQGPMGPQGLEGPAGESFDILGVLESVDLLPTPTEDLRNDAYLVKVDSVEHLYVIIGEPGSLIWHDAGAMGGVPGPQGPQGPQGVQGPTGSTGARGPRGFSGSSIFVSESTDPEQRGDTGIWYVVLPYEVEPQVMTDGSSYIMTTKGEVYVIYDVGEYQTNKLAVYISTDSTKPSPITSLQLSGGSESNVSYDDKGAKLTTLTIKGNGTLQYSNTLRSYQVTKAPKFATISIYKHSLRSGSKASEERIVVIPVYNISRTEALFNDYYLTTVSFIEAVDTTPCQIDVMVKMNIWYNVINKKVYASVYQAYGNDLLNINDSSKSSTVEIYLKTLYS